MENKLITALKKSDIQKIKKLFKELDLDQMKFIDRAILLEKILQASKINDPDFEKLNIITEKWLGNLESGDLDGFIGDLCGLISISIDSIVYVMMGYQDILIEEILTLQLETNSFNFNLIATRLIEAYQKYLILQNEKDEIQNDVWKRLLDIAEEKKRKDAINFINFKLNLNSKIAPKPKYMKTQCEKVIEIDENNVRQKATEVTKSLFKKKEIIDNEIMNKLDNYIESFTQTDCINIVSFLNAEKQYVDDPDMLEGPSNSIIYEKINTVTNEKEITVHECLGAPESRKFKGCRMLTCTCINEDIEDESDVLPFQWFKGKCDRCKNKILKVCYAFRLPLDAGGWVGCFCSSACALNDANDHIKRGLKGEEAFEHFNRFNEIEAIILHKGILDN